MPFRVTCLLGLDEDAFPARDVRRDRSTASSRALDTRERRARRPSRARRRPLSVPAAVRRRAGRVLYLSWCGIDPRDAVAARTVGHGQRTARRRRALPRHGDGEEVREALVVRHALQPFAPAAVRRAARRRGLPDARRAAPFQLRRALAARRGRGTARCGPRAPCSRPPRCALPAMRASTTGPLSPGCACVVRCCVRTRPTCRTARPAPARGRTAAATDHEPLGAPDAPGSNTGCVMRCSMRGCARRAARCAACMRGCWRARWSRRARTAAATVARRSKTSRRSRAGAVPTASAAPAHACHVRATAAVAHAARRARRRASRRRAARGVDRRRPARRPRRAPRPRSAVRVVAGSAAARAGDPDKDEPPAFVDANCRAARAPQPRSLASLLALARRGPARAAAVPARTAGSYVQADAPTRDAAAALKPRATAGPAAMAAGRAEAGAATRWRCAAAIRSSTATRVRRRASPLLSARRCSRRSPARRRFDPERVRMSATVFDTPLDARSLIEASAGTGKTYRAGGAVRARGDRRSACACRRSSP